MLIANQMSYMEKLKTSSKIKTTILMDKTLKKLAQVYAIQNEMSLGDLVEEVLSEFLTMKK